MDLASTPLTHTVPYRVKFLEKSRPDKKLSNVVFPAPIKDLDQGRV